MVPGARARRHNGAVDAADEELLAGGNTSGPVMRVGGTVRKLAGPWTPAVESLLRHLESADFDGAPRTSAETRAAGMSWSTCQGSLPQTFRPWTRSGCIASAASSGSCMTSLPALSHRRVRAGRPRTSAAGAPAATGAFFGTGAHGAGTRGCHRSWPRHPAGTPRPHRTGGPAHLCRAPTA